MLREPQRDEDSGDWEELTDPDTSEVYYHNRRTDETSWEKPASIARANNGEGSINDEGGLWEKAEDQQKSEGKQMAHQRQDCGCDPCRERVYCCFCGYHANEYIKQ